MLLFTFPFAPPFIPVSFHSREISREQASTLVAACHLLFCCIKAHECFKTFSFAAASGHMNAHTANNKCLIHTGERGRCKLCCARAGVGSSSCSRVLASNREYKTPAAAAAGVCCSFTNDCAAQNLDDEEESVYGWDDEGLLA
jgi:hypothetical protein